MASLADAAARKAQSLRIPILPITQKTDLMKIGDYVFQVGYTTRHQMADLVRQAREKGYDDFGIFSPKNNYGAELASMFKLAVQTQGGRVISQASYETSDLSSQARLLKMAAGVASSGKKSRMDAVFVPDSYASMPRVTSALEFAGLDDIPLLGTNAWNDPQLTAETLKSFPGSFFLDLFNGSDHSPLTSAFVAGFKEAQGRNPTSLEALAFDALWFVRQSGQSGSSRKIRDSLLEGGLKGVTAIDGFAAGDGPVIHPFLLKPRAADGEGDLRQASH